MGEIVGLCIGSYEFLSRKNTFGDLLSIFSQDDLTIEEVFDKELDESITRRYFTTTVNNAKMCLDVMGHTTLKAKSLFEYHKKNYLDYLEEDFDDEVDSDNIERKYTFENWARAVKKYSSILASDIYENGDYISLEKCRGENNSLCEKIVLDSLPHCKDDTYFGIDFYYLDEEIGSPWDVFRIILEAFKQDFYERLNFYAPDKPAAQNIANSLQLYVTGSQNVFNHRSNVDTQNRVVCFDIRELGTTLRKAGMLIVQHMVWTRVSQNRSRRKSTRYYVDEFHLLLNQPQTANYSIEMWKRFRKWGGIITGISQNVTDFLGSLAVESIVGNSDFILMLNQHSGDQKILAEKLNISKHQISFVNNSNAGEGLLFYGNVIIPFADRYPQDTRTYALMSTKPDEIQT